MLWDFRNSVTFLPRHLAIFESSAFRLSHRLFPTHSSQIWVIIRHLYPLRLSSLLVATCLLLANLRIILFLCSSLGYDKLENSFLFSSLFILSGCSLPKILPYTCLLEETLHADASSLSIERLQFELPRRPQRGHAKDGSVFFITKPSHQANNRLFHSSR